MEEFEKFVSEYVGWINGYVWGWPLVVLLFGTHIFLTIRSGFIQLYLWQAIKLAFKPADKSEGDVSPYGALSTALAATVGTGNIFGVGSAVLIGGPGAVLWMWLTGILGIATKYSEALLSVRYRVKTETGEMAGGPMYVLERGLNAKWLGIIFALFTALAGFGIGNTVQSNAIATMMNDHFTVPHWITGVVLCLLVGAVLLGGIKSIASVCSFLVPIMAGIYILACIALIIVFLPQIPSTIALIFTDAFSGTALAGGGFGAMIKIGIQRGLFSNESGLGSAPIAAAAAKTPNAVRQGLVSSTGPFWDTVVVCALTGIVMVAAGEWANAHTWENPQDKAMLASLTFAKLGTIGTYVLTFALLTFVLSTLLGWSYYGEKSLEYLTGSWVIPYYRVAWVLAIFVGAITDLSLVWLIADTLNGLMAMPNLVALICLSGVIVAETRRHAAYLQGNDGADLIPDLEDEPRSSQ